MISLPEKIQKTISHLTKIPGVGEKTAFRYIMNVMKWDTVEIENLSKSINGLLSISYCEDCGSYCEYQKCSLCQSEARLESQTICVVEQFTDLMAIENSGRYQGLFHILGGVLNPLAGVGPHQLRIEALISRVSQFEKCSLILAINPSVEGDATCSYLKEVLPNHVQIERIGFGIPIGGSLEFLDPMTISKALENKQVF